MAEATISVIIPAQDHQLAIGECLRCIFRQSRVPEDIVLVDRGSRDDTRSIIEENFPSVRVLKTLRKTNIARALNLGVRHTDSHWVGILFPEVKLESGYFKAVLRVLEATHHSSLGFATGKIFKMFRGSGILDSTGLELPDGDILPRKRGEGMAGEGTYGEMEPVLGPARGAAVYRRSLLEDSRVFGEVFDESLNEVMEDVDLAWRAHLQGWKGLYVPEAVATYDVRDEGPGPTFPNAINWEFGKRFVTLKNAPTDDLLANLPRILFSEPHSLMKAPAMFFPVLFALADVAFRLTEIRCKRQVIQRRATATKDPAANLKAEP